MFENNLKSYHYLTVPYWWIQIFDPPHPLEIYFKNPNYVSKTLVYFISNLFYH